MSSLEVEEFHPVLWQMCGSAAVMITMMTMMMVSKVLLFGRD